MAGSPQDVYAKYLPKHCGYPLRVPELSNAHQLPREYREDGVQIGDVGVVDPERGFDVLFNVCKPADHPLHARWHNKGFPVFDPIRLNYRDIFVKPDAVLPGTVISSGVTRIRSPSDQETQYEFVPDAADGAILILSRGATLHDFIPKDQFRDFATNHAMDWYRFIAQNLRRQIDNNSLYLITGYYKAQYWSLASFKNASPSVNSRQIWLTKVDNSENYDWGSTFDIQWSDGPRRGSNQNPNQCVFLRGFKIAMKDEIFGLVTQRVTDLVAGRELRSVIKWRPLSLLKWIFKWKKASETVSSHNPTLDPTHEPQLSQPFHPSNIMNRYLLSKDSAMTVAVTHDSEWIDFIDKERLSSDQLIQEGYFVEFLSGQCLFDPQHGIVYLVEVEGEELRLQFHVPYFVPSECSTAEGSEHKSPGGPVAEAEITEPCSGNSHRTVNIITGIRGDQLTEFGCAPIECHVLVQSGDRKWRTKDRSVTSGEVTEWRDSILLPSELSATLRISICTFSESISEAEVLHAQDIILEKLLEEEFIEFPRKGNAVEECSCPSLLFTTDRKNQDDLDESYAVLQLFRDASTNFRSREESLRLAKDAERDKRWEDVVNHMKNIVRLDLELTTEERDLFSCGYERLIAAYRALCDSQKLEGEIIHICEEVLEMLERHLIPSTASAESVVLYGRMVADYHRCTSDFHAGVRRKHCIEKSLAAYMDTSSIAKCGLQTTHPIRLQVALNFSLLYHEVLHDLDKAIGVANKALEDVGTGVEEGPCEKDAMALMELLRDNVARWKLEGKDKGKVGQCDAEKTENNVHEKAVPQRQPRHNICVEQGEGSSRVVHSVDSEQGLKADNNSPQQTVEQRQPKEEVEAEEQGVGYELPSKEEEVEDGSWAVHITDSEQGLPKTDNNAPQRVIMQRQPRKKMWAEEDEDSSQADIAYSRRRLPKTEDNDNVSQQTVKWKQPRKKMWAEEDEDGLQAADIAYSRNRLPKAEDKNNLAQQTVKRRQPRKKMWAEEDEGALQAVHIAEYGLPKTGDNAHQRSARPRKTVDDRQTVVKLPRKKQWEE